MKKSRCVGQIVGRKGEQRVRTTSKPRTVDEDVSESQSSITIKTHRSRAAGYVVPVDEAESSENYLPVPIPLKWRGPDDGDSFRCRREV